MEITLNGESRSVDYGLSVATLVASMEVGTERYAVEINEQIIPRSTHGEHLIREGDRIEIVVAIGGG